MRYTPIKPYLLAETPETLTARLAEAGHPSFRAAQILDWVYKKFTLDPAAMTNLPAPVREWLADTFTLLPTRHVLTKGDPDTTQKLLLELGDKSLIETVLLKAPADNTDDPNDAGEDDEDLSANTPEASAIATEVPQNSPAPTGRLRHTVCISTQVGCAYGCKFCASGLAGWRRDLHAGEILAQLFQIVALVGPRTSDKGPALPFDNIVVMGMGEPLANFENLLHALTTLNAPWGFNFGARRVTVSTSGVVPKILELAELPTQFRLAISLHGATNAVRDQIMPVNKKYPLEVLIPAVYAYIARHNRMLTFEYILINELNDTYEQADALIEICKGQRVHVNCIPYNTVEGLQWARPSITRQQNFVKRLKAANISVTIRREKGHKIEAACGQLRLQEEKKRETPAT